MKKTFVLFSALLLMSATNIYAKPLQLNLVKGETYKIKTTTSSAITQQMAGMSVEVGLTIDFNTNMKVMQVISDSIYKLEVSYEKFQFAIKSQFANVDINSDNADANDKASNLVKSMVNKPFYMSLTKTGKVLSLNADSLIASVANQAENFSEAERASLMQQINQSFGNESIKGSLENYFSIYSGNVEKVGDTWTNTGKLRSTMELDMTTKYKVASIENGICTITLESEVASIPDQVVEQNGMKMKYNVNGTIEGSYKIDMKSGWIIEGQNNQTLKGQADIEANDQLPEGMALPMTIISDTKISK